MIKKMSKTHITRQLRNRPRGLVKDSEVNSKSEDERLEEKFKELSKAFKVSNSAGGDIA